MLALTLIIMGLATSFYYIAQNQIEFDDLTEEEIDNIPYRTYSGAMWYLGDILLGSFNRSIF